MDPADPQQLNGYAYGNNAPATQTDPDGLRSDVVGGKQVGNAGQIISVPHPRDTDGGRRAHRSSHPKVPHGASIESDRGHSAGQSASSGRSSSARASNSRHWWDDAGDVIGDAASAVKQPALDVVRGVGNVAWGAGQGMGELGAIADGPGGYMVYKQFGEPLLDEAHAGLEEWGGGEKSGWYYGAYSTGLVASFAFGGGEANAAAKVSRLVEGATPKVASAGGSLINKVKSRVIAKVDDLPCSCFVAGTKVMTAHGKVAVEKIRPGMKVWAKNLKTGRSELRPVTGLFPKKSATLMTIALTSGVVVVVTEEHPFMVDDEGWVMSGDLKTGDTLQKRDGGSVAIAHITVVLAEVPVFNFTVSGDHDYYVADAQLLVHN